MSTATKTIKQLNEEAKSKLVEAKSIYDKGDDATPDELERAGTLTSEATTISDNLAKVTGENRLNAMKTANRIENTLASLGAPDRLPFGSGLNGDGATASGVTGAAGRLLSPHIKSVGERFLEDETYGNWVKTFAPGGIAPRCQFMSPRVSFEDGAAMLDTSAIKTIVYQGGSTSGGPFSWNDQRRDIVVPAPFRPFTIRSLITTLQTNSDAVEYIRITGYTNAAAATAEATSSSGSSGSKPESAMATLLVTDTIKTIAHWIPATTRILQDAPQLRGIIDQFLRDGLEEELEDQIVAGNGSGENFTGILNVSGTTAQAYDTDLLTTTRKARTKVKVTGRAIPNGYLLHPTDWESIDLLQDAEQRYYFGGPTVLGTPRLWGLPVVESEAMTQGSGTCADHRQCVFWDRQAMMISVGNQHSDYFVRNIVAILGELRGGFGVLRPAAIVVMDLTP